MKILVTGLCLQGNKGGTALAQSLKKVLGDEFPDAEFTYSVPSADFAREKAWGEKLGLEVVRKISIKDFLPPWRFKGLSRQRRKAFMGAMGEADLVVELTALTYVGPPKGKTIGPLQSRFLYFLLARLKRKQFLAWTQTYGPFSNLPMRLMAKADLKRQPVVFCRGNDCQRAVNELLPGKETRVYPDVACVLPYSTEAGDALLGKWVEPGDGSKLASVSPSAVLYQSSDGEGGANEHVKFCVELCRDLTSKGFRVILVPHTFRPDSGDPTACDKAVCDIVAAELETGAPPVVDDDLSAIDLKSIISRMHIHIGGRYHSIIAALSSAVPCISLSWHPKYRDAMELYGIGDFVLAADKPFGKSGGAELIACLCDSREEFSEGLAERHSEIREAIADNAKRFSGLYPGILNKSHGPAAQL